MVFGHPCLPISLLRPYGRARSLIRILLRFFSLFEPLRKGLGQSAALEFFLLRHRPRAHFPRFDTMTATWQRPPSRRQLSAEQLSR